MRFLLVYTMAMAGIVAPGHGFAQGLFGPAEGSRPGQTYQSGGPRQPAPSPTTQAPPPPPPNNPQQPLAPPPTGAGPLTPANAPSDNGMPTVGTPLIMEFSDLQCPDSMRYGKGLKQDIIRRYVATGKVMYKWYDFPLDFHPKAPEAAVAARCAGTSADAMRTMIMNNQADMTPQAYSRYARQLGLNVRTFDACLRSKKPLPEVHADMRLGKSYGVGGTPMLVLGIADGKGGFQFSKLVKGYDPPPQVLGEIDSFLASVNAPRQRVLR